MRTEVVKPKKELFVPILSHEFDAAVRDVPGVADLDHFGFHLTVSLPKHRAKFDAFRVCPAYCREAL